MLRRIMRHDLRVADKLYIKKVLLVLEDFLFFLSFLVLLYSKASYDFETVPTYVSSWFPRKELRAPCSVFRYPIELPVSPTPDPARYTDSNTNSLGNALYDCRSSRFDIAFHGICAKTKPNMRYRFQVSWWNSAVWKSFAASLECFVCQFSKYTWKPEWSIWFSFANLQSEFLDFLAASLWPKLFHRPLN
jgi:hypothetical protein